jgi:hypothetical protein
MSLIRRSPQPVRLSRKSSLTSGFSPQSSPSFRNVSQSVAGPMRDTSRAELAERRESELLCILHKRRVPTYPPQKLEFPLHDADARRNRLRKARLLSSALRRFEQALWPPKRRFPLIVSAPCISRTLGVALEGPSLLLRARGSDSQLALRLLGRPSRSP